MYIFTTERVKWDSYLICTAGRKPGFGAWQGGAVPTGGSDSWRERVPVGPSGRGATDAPLSLRSSCDLPRCLWLPSCTWSEEHGLGHARWRKQGGFSASAHFLLNINTELQTILRLVHILLKLTFSAFHHMVWLT